MPFVIFYIFPYNKANATDNDQTDNREIYDKVVGKGCERGIWFNGTHQIESCIAKGRNRMKDAIPNSFCETKYRIKTEREDDSTDSFKNSSANQNISNQPNNTTQL